MMPVSVVFLGYIHTWCLVKAHIFVEKRFLFANSSIAFKTIRIKDYAGSSEPQSQPALPLSLAESALNVPCSTTKLSSTH